jgi:hypothetical protein
MIIKLHIHTINIVLLVHNFEQELHKDGHFITLFTFIQLDEWGDLK